jgi:hypothetical protein
MVFLLPENRSSQSPARNERDPVAREDRTVAAPSRDAISLQGSLSELAVGPESLENETLRTPVKVTGSPDSRADRAEAIPPDVPDDKQVRVQREPIPDWILYAQLEPISAGTLDTNPVFAQPVLLSRTNTARDYSRVEKRDFMIQFKREKQETPRERKLSFWRLANAGIHRINEIAEEDISLVRETDEEGKIRRLTFESSNFGISAPIRTQHNPSR